MKICTPLDFLKQYWMIYKYGHMDYLQIVENKYSYRLNEEIVKVKYKYNVEDNNYRYI
ncbi:hypothetical protein IMG5_171600 [Ichthyophthirius multifiliis]|uniref:Uncharacterized protein n=1 Tax=Ichthyophthirius multifiliis TaxID=5932 RepID=G0R1N0_ICHMU|nr:hypothetical protein IMG5_171600 [Ichthyophthirius multifiliis]EGR28624.1 hypothetical protein IMG5_171600 [Ichthyophthirius multifiliis]|eukprot:XP_004029860.1 hypothetical protein IMG5_171600 [Ichthyophthirius multifiliis]